MAPGRENHLRKSRPSMAQHSNFVRRDLWSRAARHLSRSTGCTAAAERAGCGRQCRRHRFFRRAAANSNRTGHRSRREDFHRSKRTVAARRRSAAHGRAARGAARRRAKAIHLQRRGDRAGVRRRARRQLSAEHLRGGNFGLWTSDRGARAGRASRGTFRPARRTRPSCPACGAARAARGRSGRSTARPAK